MSRYPNQTSYPRHAPSPLPQQQLPSQPHRAWQPGPPPDLPARDDLRQQQYEFDDEQDIAPWYGHLILRTVPPIFHTLRAKITMPLDRASLLIQCGAFHNPLASFVSALPTLRRIREVQGIRSLWRGLDGDLLQAVPQSIFRSFFGLGLRIIPAALIGPNRFDRMISAAPELFTMMTEVAMTAAFYPVNSSITRHQLEFPQKLTASTVDRMRRTGEEEGVSGFYRGVMPQLAAVAVGGLTWSALIFPLKVVLLRVLQLPPAPAFFSCYLIASPIIAAVTYPLNTISKMQLLQPEKTPTECAKELYRREGGWRNFYRGYWPYCCSITVNHMTTALIFVIVSDATRAAADEMMEEMQQQQQQQQESGQYTYPNSPKQ